jgi:hypothetical protein
MKISSREYKVIIDAAVFADVASGLDRLLEDMAQVGRDVGIVVRDEFDSEKPKKHLIRFLETQESSLLANDLLLRQRMRSGTGEAEYTLTCRSTDHFIAAAKDVSAPKRFDPESKLEEDISPPFVSKLSHSTTVDVGSKLAGDNFPGTLAAASVIFPGLLKVGHDGRMCSPKAKLLPVSEPPVFERLFRGPTLKTGKGEEIGPIAVILWTREKMSKLLIAELSFRHEDIKEKRMGTIAPVTKRFFEGLQRQTWARPEAIGKTEFMYDLQPGAGRLKPNHEGANKWP